jgi:hypothetical protein
MLILYKIAENYKGRFATAATLQTSYPIASLASYAYVNVQVPIGIGIPL